MGDQRAQGMLTVITLLKLKPSPNGEKHGERAFWREFGTRYLETWLGNVERYVPHPHRAVVMTDSPYGICIDTAAVRMRDVNLVTLDNVVNAPGFWAKLNMFRPEVSSGKCLYLDLDNVVNGPLDELCALEPDPLIMLDDRRVPGLPNGSAILFDAEACREIWQRYASEPRETERTWVARGEDYTRAYDQAYIASWLNSFGRHVPLFQDLLPDGYILNARSELPNAPDWKAARLIFGCGTTKPHTSTHPAFALR